MITFEAFLVIALLVLTGNLRQVGAAPGQSRSVTSNTVINAYDEKWGYITSDSYPNAYGYYIYGWLDLDVPSLQSDYIALRADVWNWDYSSYGDRLTIYSYNGQSWYWIADLYAWSDPNWFVTLRSVGRLSFSWYTDGWNYMGGVRNWRLKWTYQKFVFGCELSPQPYVFNNRTTSGVLQSPFFPNHYPVDSYCQTIIDVDQSVDALEFNRKLFHFRENDKLYFYTGDAQRNAWVLYDTYDSAKSPPEYFRIYGVDVKVLFTSDNVACSYGYQIYWRLFSKERYSLPAAGNLIALYPLTAAHRGTDIINGCNAINYPTDGSIYPVIGPSGSNGGALYFRDAFLNMTDPSCALSLNSSLSFSLAIHTYGEHSIVEFVSASVTDRAAYITTSATTFRFNPMNLDGNLLTDFNFDTMDTYRDNLVQVTATWNSGVKTGRLFYDNALKKSVGYPGSNIRTTKGLNVGMSDPRSGFNPQPLNGRVSCLSVYSDALLIEDVALIRAACEKLTSQYEIYPATSLVAWLPLNGYNAGSRLFDASGNGYHGLQANINLVTPTTGYRGVANTATAFTGVDNSNSYAIGPYDLTFLNKAFTINALIFPTSSEHMPIFEMKNAAGTRGFIMMQWPVNTGNFHIRLNSAVNVGSDYIHYTGVNMVNKWQFVTATWSVRTGLLTAMINGTVVGTYNYGSGANVGVGPGGFFIGAVVDGFNRWKGKIACISIYRTALTPTQVQRVMKHCHQTTNQPNLNVEMMGFWPLTNLTGTLDISGNEHHGTAMSANLSLVPGPFGVPNTAYEFGKDVNSFIKMPAGNQFNLAARSWTMACWIKLHSGEGAIIEYVSGPNQPGVSSYFHWWIYRDFMWINLHGDTSLLAQADGTAGYNVWQFVAISYDYENQKLTAWRDGSKLGEWTMPAATFGDYGFNIGNRYGFPLPGQMACLSIYEVSMDAEGIGRLMSMCQSYLMDWKLRDQEVRSGEVSCNFDNGFCGWSQDSGDNGDWTLARDATSLGRQQPWSTGPRFGKNQERIEANDQYLLLAATPNAVTTEARLNSPHLSPGWHCLSFWYYMSGKDVYAMHVLVGLTNRIFTAEMRSKKQWRFAAISFYSGTNDFLSIDGYVSANNGGKYGDLAIDDIRLTEGNCTSSMPCPKGWREFGTKCYMPFLDYPQTFPNFKANCRDRLQARIAMPENPEEAAFLGSLMGSLTLIHIGGEFDVSRNKWVHVNSRSDLKYTPYAPNEPQVGETCLLLDNIGRFHGSWCESFPAVCEINKLEAEHLTFNCTFDSKHLCGWWNNVGDDSTDSFGNSIEADVNAGISLPWADEDKTNGPEWDWNHGSNRGFYLMHYDQQPPACNGYKADIYSPWMKRPGRPQCLRIRFYRTYHTNSFDVMFWTHLAGVEWYYAVAVGQDTAWRTLQFEINPPRDYMIILRFWFSCNTGGFGNIIVDDIQLFDSTCLIPTWTDKQFNYALNTLRPQPSWDQATDSLGDANFYNCDHWGFWRNLLANSDTPYTKAVDAYMNCASWKHANGYRRTGPQSDYTGEGSYTSADVQTGVSLKSKARLNGPAIPSGQHCFIFHYFMHGYDMGELRLFDDKGRYLFARQGPQTPSWKEHRLLLNDLSPTTPFFESSSGLKDDVTHFQKYQSIQLDDIYTRNGSDLCLGYMDCDFDRSPYLTDCGWQQNDTDDGDWVRWSGETPANNALTGPAADNTNGLGSYLYVDATGLKPGARTRVHMPPMMAGQFCLTFYYHMFGSDMGTLRVFYVPQDNLANSNGNYPPYTEIDLWNRTGNRGNYWNRAMVPLNFSYPQIVAFEAVRGPGDRSDIALDDVVVLKGSCPNDRGLSCSFERRDLCNWYNDPTAQGSFEVRKGKTPGSPLTGPEGDLTGLYAGGFYAFVDSSKLSFGQTARIISPTMPAASTICFEAFYNSRGRQVGTLNVYRNEDLLYRVRGGVTGYEWRRIRFTIRSNTTFVVKLEFVDAPGPNDLAIDDLSIRDGPCSPNEQPLANVHEFKSVTGYLGTHSMDLYNATSLRECIGICLKTAGCRSLHFGATQKVCRLKSATMDTDPYSYGAGFTTVWAISPLQQMIERMENLCQRDSPTCTPTSTCNNYGETSTGLYACQCKESSVLSCFMPPDCHIAYKNGYIASGAYLIQPGLTAPPVPVRCEMDLVGGKGYTVIGYRYNGGVRFTKRRWNQYTQFFGTPLGEYWLGLESMTKLTNLAVNGYIVESQSYRNATPNAPIVGMTTQFKVAAASDKYRITLQTQDATGMTSLMHNAQFSAPDADNTGNDGCVKYLETGWWFKNCANGHLTGTYGPGLNMPTHRYHMSMTDVATQSNYGLAMMKWKVTRI